MERVDEEEQAQESSRGSTGAVGRAGTQRGQATREQGQWPQGRFGQKPQEDRRGAAQCASTTPGASQEAVNLLIKLICTRYGQLTIGWGDGGIRYRAAGH
jgi:hypothetical protein